MRINEHSHRRTWQKWMARNRGMTLRGTRISLRTPYGKDDVEAWYETDDIDLADLIHYTTYGYGEPRESRLQRIRDAFKRLFTDPVPEPDLPLDEEIRNSR